MGIFRKNGKEEESGVDLEKRDISEEKTFRHGMPWFVRGAAVSIVCAVLFSSLYGVFRSNAEKYMRSPVEESNVISWLYQNCYLLYRDLYNSQNERQWDYADIYLDMDEKYQWLLDEKNQWFLDGNSLDEYMEYLETEIGKDNVDAILQNLWSQGMLEEYTAQGFLDEFIAERVLDESRLAWYILQGYLDESALEIYIDQGLLDGVLLSMYLDQGLTMEGEHSIGENSMEEHSADGNMSDGVLAYEPSSVDWDEIGELKREIGSVKSCFQELENSFRNLNSNFDYIIEDNQTGNYVTNMSLEDRNRGMQQQYFLLSFVFDSAGNVTVQDNICGNDTSKIRKHAYEAIRENVVQNAILENTDVFRKYGKVKVPVDCTVTFAISKDVWTTQGGSYYSNWYTIDAYRDAGVGGILFLCALCVALLGFLLPLPEGRKPWMNEKICAITAELLLGFVCAGFILGEFILRLIVYVASNEAGGAFARALTISLDSAAVLADILNLLALTLYFFCLWYVGICARAVRELHMREYIRQRSLIYRFFPFVKGKAVDVYEAVSHMDLTQDARKTIIRVLVVNAVILFFISCLWFGGLAITLVYSFVLYLILRKYISDLQARYRILLRAVDEIAQGHLDVTINEDLGVFEPFREQIFKIQDGLQKAVDTEVRSQRMRVELVTNMSHDLKTPLTAIITYINLLGDENVTEEQRREYLATLERKSLRLKSLIEDLFEFSKANSQNVTLNIMDVDIMNLVKQVSFEMSDKISESGLDVRLNLTDEKVIVPLDSQKTYRIYENLFGNIAKYALPGTRVYVNGFRIDDTVVITLKNISAEEITVDVSELTERFVRGDASRNTEGSGLGLAIAKSFTELQGGQLTLEADGDLFKVTTTWHIGTSAQ